MSTKPATSGSADARPDQAPTLPLAAAPSSRAEAEAPAPGGVVAGRYRLERPLGRGGMGEVWLARHLALDCRRALKLVRSGAPADPLAAERLRLEGRLMERLRGPAIPAIHDAGFADGLAFLAMDYIPGASLDRLLRLGEPRSLGWVARLLGRLAGALDRVHARGAVHGDIKPANLLLAADRPRGEELMLLDFGVARASGHGPAGPGQLGPPGAFLGSPGYASPEQLRGDPLDARSDLYAVGVLLFELLTGRRPFEGTPWRLPPDGRAAPSFAAVCPTAEAPPAVESLVRRCLASDPAERPRSAGALAVAFRLAAGRRERPRSSRARRSAALARRPSRSVPVG